MARSNPTAEFMSKYNANGTLKIQPQSVRSGSGVTTKKESSKDKPAIPAHPRALISKEEKAMQLAKSTMYSPCVVRTVAVVISSSSSRSIVVVVIVVEV